MIASHVGNLSTTVKNACISRAADSPIVPASAEIVTDSPNIGRFLAMCDAFSKLRGVTKAA